jgi:hypothetical protein
MPTAPVSSPMARDPERQRLDEDDARKRNWKRWGPYLSERQWGTVREDYSAGGNCWEYLPHDHARSRAYRWGEDGLLGFTDRECRFCFALCLWNGHDPILKERAFGLTNGEGNHGEDVKEIYHYLEATPTASYCKALYKYPLQAYPYQQLVEENHRRGHQEPEFELLDTGVFDAGHADVQVEYAKGGEDDILVRITVTNRSSQPAHLHVLPTAWFKNTWSWGDHVDGTTKPSLAQQQDRTLLGVHQSLGRFRLATDGDVPWIFTENETNTQALFGVPLATPYVKDAFHRRVVAGEVSAVNPQQQGTKAAAWYQIDLDAGASREILLRWRPEGVEGAFFGEGFTQIFAQRQAESALFYQPLLHGNEDERSVARQAFAGLIWCKQFYQLVMTAWQQGDPAQPAPPASHAFTRNHDWPHLYARDVLSMPDSWEYPWFAAWDLAFHCIPFARIDPSFAKAQLELLLREWYMHPNGQIPAYEFAFGDVNPPVHAWAAWRVYRIGVKNGTPDLGFLERVFQKLLMNFTWWVNRKDPSGKHIFSGGFLGLDNIGVFDRSRPLPEGCHLAQADGTAWMACYAARMLTIALELARTNPSYEDIASKFFEHFVAIADAINNFGDEGLWDEQDGFYYDQMRWQDGRTEVLRVRSAVGLIAIFAHVVLKREHLERFPSFAKRLQWFELHRKDLTGRISWLTACPGGGDLRLLAIPSRAQLARVLARVFDEHEFLSPHGIRSLSRVHAEHPFVLTSDGTTHAISYEPGESSTGVFGGNSNWRGPIWFPINYLMIEALREYHQFYGDDFKVSVPSVRPEGLTLLECSHELARRQALLFLKDANGRRPCHGEEQRYTIDPAWNDLVLFHEYFHGDSGRGLGASHQTGWTALVSEYLGGVR